jgi:hypothetical protein
MSDAAPPENDSSIPSDTELWRRIPGWQWVPDDSIATGFRPSSDAFDDDELSVVIAAECAGGIPTLLAGHEGFGVASFTVAEIRSRGWGIIRVPDDLLPGHSHVTGKKKTKSKRTSLAKTCRMLVNPTTE